MRIVSLLPDATEVLLALGLEDELVGVTHRCDVPATAGDPAVLTRTGSAGGDALDAAALVDADPDLVIVGDGRDGSVTGRLIEAAFADADEVPSVLTHAPTTVEGVLNAIVSIGAMTEAEDEAIAVVEGLRERLRELQRIVLGRRDGGFRPPRIVLLESVDPPRTVGRWIPDQVRLAGGWELLGQAGGMGETTTWEAVADVDPEVLVLLPGGLPLTEAMQAWEASGRPPGWDDLGAVQAGRAFVVDGGPFMLAGPRVVDGIEIMAELIDPAAFDGMSPPATWLPVS
jgi:iron complex transport system substrate-binding protein